MYIRSRYMDAVEEIKAELMHIAWRIAEMTKALEKDEIFTGDWTDNDCAIAHDDLKQDLEEMQRTIDTAVEDLADIIAREKVRL